MSRTGLFRIWLLFLCWPLWNLFPLAFLLISEGPYDFSRSRTKFIIWLRILPGATGIPLSSEILPEHSVRVLWLQWSLRYRETLTFILTFQSFGQLELQVPALLIQFRGFLCFHLCPGSVSLEADQRQPPGFSSCPISGPFVKNIQPVPKRKVLVKGQLSSAGYTGRKGAHWELWVTLC